MPGPSPYPKGGVPRQAHRQFPAFCHPGSGGAPDDAVPALIASPDMGARGTVAPPFVPVLLYHAITDTPGQHIAPFSVSPAAFEQQLDLLVAAGYRCVTFGELMRQEAIGAVAADGPGADGRAPGDQRVAVITFDDGYADFATAAVPALRARSLVSTLYLTTGWLDGGAQRTPGPSDPMLAFDQLAELRAEGVELGAHSHSHPQMDTLGMAALRDELTRPKELLEDVLGTAVTTFAYPHGYNGPKVRRMTREVGYESGAGVRNAVHRPGEDRYAISRLTVTRATTPTEFSSWLDGVDGVRAITGEAWETKGWRAYRRGRAILRRRPGSDYQ